MPLYEIKKKILLNIAKDGKNKKRIEKRRCKKRTSPFVFMKIKSCCKIKMCLIKKVFIKKSVCEPKS